MGNESGGVLSIAAHHTAVLILIERGEKHALSFAIPFWLVQSDPILDSMWGQILSNVLALTLLSWLFFKLRSIINRLYTKKYGVRHPVLGENKWHFRLNEPNRVLKRSRRRSAALLKFHIKALMSPRLLAAIRLLMLPAFALANFIAYISSLEFFATFMSIPEDKPLIYGALLVKGFAAAALVCNPLKPTEVTPQRECHLWI